MKKFDVIVIGSGSGLDVVSYADEQNMKVALIEKGPLGGTCLNRGCIPSKMLIHSADVVETIRSSNKFGIISKIENIDFPSIVKRVSDSVDNDSKMMTEALKKSAHVTFYNVEGKFTGKKVLSVGNEEITAETIIIAAGTRPFVPLIKGLDKIKYMTSRDALRITKQPKHMVIIGGGFIAAELGYFFGALGTKVTFLVREGGFLKNEDSEIAQWFTKEFSKKCNVNVNTQAEEFGQRGGEITIKLKGKNEFIKCDAVLVATGRESNADILNVKATEVDTTEKGFVKVDNTLKTNVDGIWAFGDIIGKMPLKHSANHEVNYVIKNVFHQKNEPVDYFAIGHAVFSSPQVAGVGKTEEQLKTEGVRYKVGKYELKNVAMGDALMENGLVKVLADENRKILGVHIVGPEAAILIHEAIIAMKTTGNVKAIYDTVYVHPALPEWVQRAFELAY